MGEEERRKTRRRRKGCRLAGRRMGCIVTYVRKGHLYNATKAKEDEDFWQQQKTRHTLRWVGRETKATYAFGDAATPHVFHDHLPLHPPSHPPPQRTTRTAQSWGS